MLLHTSQGSEANIQSSTALLKTFIYWVQSLVSVVYFWFYLPLTLWNQIFKRFYFCTSHFNKNSFDTLSVDLTFKQQSGNHSQGKATRSHILLCNKKCFFYYVYNDIILSVKNHMQMFVYFLFLLLTEYQKGQLED